MTARRWVPALVVALVLTAGACTAPKLGSAKGRRNGTPTSATPKPTVSDRQPTPTPSSTITPPIDGSARECGPAPDPSPPDPEPTEIPEAIRAVSDQTEALRGLEFRTPLDLEAVTGSEMTVRIREAYVKAYPEAPMAARGEAWIAMGVIPAGTDLLQTYLDFAGGQVLGYYETVADELVFIGTESPSPLEREVLSHELTHALDDQWFGLERLDDLAFACLDEQVAAFRALVEGNASYHEQLWVQTYLTPLELAELLLEAGSLEPPPASVPQFVQDLELSPYGTGRAFVEALLARGGEGALNAAFEAPPVSTEQILHPERYPSDEPRPVVVADVGDALGSGWTTLDILDVGEGWLRTMLDVRVPFSEAVAAADGWDGGQYRAWTDGSGTAVRLDTVWDSPAQADAFAAAMDGYAQGMPVTVLTDGETVSVLFGSDAAVLADLLAASN